MRNQIYKISRFLVAASTIGRDEQSFLDANWVRLLLRVTPKFLKNRVAMEIIAMSPHYFYRKLQTDCGHFEFLKRENDRNQISRQKICDRILEPLLKSNFTVIDYGCGAGYLAKAVSKKVKKIFAIDISRGVIGCAKVLNRNPVTHFLHTDDMESIPNLSIDFIYSVAVIQHMPDELFDRTLEFFYRKLKKGGSIALDIVVDDPLWSTEQQWHEKKDLLGRVKLQIGLNCFSRSRKKVAAQVLAAKFDQVEIIATKKLVAGERFDDIVEQAFLFGVKS